MFHRTVLVCAALAFGACASPILAQQSVSVPLDPPRPAAAPQAEPPPPPLPPMPSTRHRWVDVGGHRSARPAAKAKHTHHGGKVTRHSAAQTHRATKKHTSIRTHRATKKHATMETHRATSKHRAMQSHKAKSSHADTARTRLSSKTVRRCHTLSYRQIMRSSDCRALMKQELAGTDKRRGHKVERHKAAAHRQKASAQHRKTTRSHHQATKRRKK